MAGPIPSDLVELGRVLGGHGVRGWIKIQPFSTDSDAMAVAKKWWLAKPTGALDKSWSTSTPIPVSVVWAKPHGNLFLASLNGISDRNESDALKGQSVFVSRQLFPPLDPDEYYWIDLMGCVVMSDASGDLVRLGVVHDMLDNPAHAILSVKRQQFDEPTGTWVDQLDGRDRPLISLIPFVGAHVASVDLAARLITTHWPADF